MEVSREGDEIIAQISCYVFIQLITRYIYQESLVE